MALQVPWPVESSHHHVDRTMASYDNKNFINLEMPTRGVNQISDNGHFFQFLVLLGNFFSSCCFVLFCFVLFCVFWFGLVWFGLVWFLLLFFVLFFVCVCGSKFFFSAQ